tara:strand:- start:2556 stop:3140 length:585 start_codon:yes stop_codon:yes gene_type:complete
MARIDPRGQVFQMLKDSGYRYAVKGSFTLSSGKKSKHYLNCKPVTLHGGGITLLSFLFFEMLPQDTDSVAGLTLGADPLVSGTAMASYLEGNPVNALIVRKEPKGHGTGAWIEGPLPPSDAKVVILEDVITTGESAIKAAEKVREAGYNVDTVLAIVNRQEGTEADDAMDAAGLKLYSIFLLEEFMENENEHTD